MPGGAELHQVRGGPGAASGRQSGGQLQRDGGNDDDDYDDNDNDNNNDDDDDNISLAWRWWWPSCEGRQRTDGTPGKIYQITKA